MKLNREQLINSVLKNASFFTNCSSEQAIAERVKKIVDEIIQVESMQERDTDPPPAEPQTYRQFHSHVNKDELNSARASFRRASDQFTLNPTLPGSDVGCYSVKTIQNIEEITLPNQVPSPPRGRRES